MQKMTAESRAYLVRMALILASAWALALLSAGSSANSHAGGRREQSNMSNQKVIMLIEAKIQPQRRAELIEAAQRYVPLVRAEPGVEAFYLCSPQDDPDTLIFYEVYRSQAAQDFHLQQEFTKKFLTNLKDAQVGDRVRKRLVEVAGQDEAHSN